MTTISIVIPAYNASKTIEETIRSVQNQTFSDFEMIVINDGSIDQTLEVLEKISDKRLKIFSYENKGVSAARNRGIENAKGEFIAFLDADDLWSPDKLERQHAELEKYPDAGVAYSWTYFMEERGNSRILHPCEPIFFQGNVYPKLLVGDFIYSGSNILVRREAVNSVGWFDSALVGCEDWDYWRRLSVQWDFVVIKKYQVYYRKSSGTASAKIEVMRNASLKAIEKAFDEAPNDYKSLRPECMLNFNRYCSSLYLQHYRDKGDIIVGTQHTLKAIQINPLILFKINTLKMLLKSILMLVLPLRIVPYLQKRFYFFRLMSKNDRIYEPSRD